MNRYKKEEMARFGESRKPSKDGGVAFPSARRLEQEFFDKAVRTLHSEIFPEENDFYGDSCVDANNRDRGINPMDSEYVDRVCQRRHRLGVSPLSANGMVANNDTELLCRRQVQSEIDTENALLTCTLDAPQIASILHEIDPLGILGIGDRNAEGVGHGYERVAREVRTRLDAGDSVTAALTGAMTSVFPSQDFQAGAVKRLVRHVHTLLLR